MAELELRIREIYDLIEPRKDFVYTAPEMLEVIKRHVEKSAESFVTEINEWKQRLEEEEDHSASLQDDIDDLKRTISELEQEISELEGQNEYIHDPL